jgi:hypothetical protein
MSKQEFARDIYREIGLQPEGRDIFISRWVKAYNSTIEEAENYYRHADNYVRIGIVKEYILNIVQEGTLETFISTKEKLNKCMELLGHPTDEDLDVLYEIKKLKGKLSTKLLKDD